MCAYRGKMWIEAIFQEIIDRDQSRSFTTVSVLPSQSSFPSHRGETRRNRLKFRRDTKNGIHKTSGQFISIYSLLFFQNSGPFFTTFIWHPVAWVSCGFYLQHFPPLPPSTSSPTPPPPSNSQIFFRISFGFVFASCLASQTTSPAQQHVFSIYLFFT